MALTLILGGEVGVSAGVTLSILLFLYATSRLLEEFIYDRVNVPMPSKYVVLMCLAVHEIDLSALETLEGVNTRLDEMGIALSLSEVKETRHGSPEAWAFVGPI